MPEAPRSVFDWEEYVRLLEMARIAAAGQMPPGIVESVSPEDIASDSVRVFEAKVRAGSYPNDPGILYGIVRHYVLQLRKKVERRKSLVAEWLERQKGHKRQNGTVNCTARPYGDPLREQFDSEANNERLFNLYASLINDDACFLAHYVKNNSLSQREWKRARKDMGWDACRYEDAVTAMVSLSERIEHGDASYQVNEVFRPMQWDVNSWKRHALNGSRRSGDSLVSGNVGLAWQYEILFRVCDIVQSIYGDGDLRISQTVTSQLKWANKASRLAQSINHLPAMHYCNLIGLSSAHLCNDRAWVDRFDMCVMGLLAHKELSVGNELGDVTRDLVRFSVRRFGVSISVLARGVNWLEQLAVSEDAKSRVRPIFQI